MTTLHMETEKVHALAKLLDREATQMLSSLSQMQSSASRLSYAWQGGGADDFRHDLSRLIKKIENHILSLETLSIRIAREADEWSGADSFGALASRGNPASRWLHAINLPGDWLATLKPSRGFWVGIGLTVVDGIHKMYGIVRDQFGRQVELSREAIQRAVLASDRLLDEGFTDLLGNPRAGASESVTLEVRGDVSIPGVIAPGSLKGEGARQVTITKEDGKYRLVLSNGGGVGIEEPLAAAKGNLKLGKQKLGLGFDASAEALLRGEVETTYEFDPSKPGDLTKMAAFMYGIGVLDSRVGPLVAPALPTLRENLVGIKMGAGVEGSAQADAHALIKLAGLEGSVEDMRGGDLRRAADGGWEIAQQREIKLDGNAALLTNERGVEVQARYETVTHIPDNGKSVKVILEIKSQSGNELDLKNLQSIAPQLNELALKKLELQGGSQKYESLQFEYTVDHPLETVREMFESPRDGMNWQALHDNSDLVIRASMGDKMGIGASAKLAIPTQKIGVGAEANMVRGSSSEIYRSK